MRLSSSFFEDRTSKMLGKQLLIAAYVPYALARDFPDRRGPKLAPKRDGVYCFFEDSTFFSPWPVRALHFVVNESAPIYTEKIKCRRTSFRGEFTSYFHTPRGLLRVYDAPRMCYWFEAPPPDNTGLDPLSVIPRADYSDKLSSLLSDARKLKIPPTDKPIHEDWFIWNNHDDVLQKMEDVCEAVAVAILRRYNSFEALCNVTYTISEEAKAAAERNDWNITKMEYLTVLQPK
ncbi:hypothetical protein FOZ60_014509 [Perkinsus olseni]|uniref:Uncharacterized protein n=1 Tax=Perkinsus olseni TaxID=32597 RepID=A0A7J6P6X9_PEROL|nr:hypothetical protein FOZ60_014509 [Perkinsus olseni]